MGIPTTIPVHHSPEATFGRLVAFGMHTTAVYFLALRISPSLVGYGSRFLFRVASVSLGIPSGDWYLQHLEVITILPALLAGYLVVRRPDSVAVWAWSIPTLILLYRVGTYNPATSVLSDSGFAERLKYFFVIQRAMPAFNNPLASDPIRIVAQMFVTAPFYAGLAYSVGALGAKRKVLQNLFASAYSQERRVSAD